MGTRSITTVLDEEGVSLVSMYRQFDGYPSGHGEELCDFLRGFEVVNGIGAGDEQKEKIANGAGCLAAQLVAHFKKVPEQSAFGKTAPKSSIGGFYLVPAGQTEEWNYYITVGKNKKITLRVVAFNGKVVYDGLAENWDTETATV